MTTQRDAQFGLMPSTIKHMIEAICKDQLGVDDQGSNVPTLIS